MNAVDSAKPAKKAIRQTIDKIESDTSAVITNDIKMMKIISEAFDSLSLRGKSVCVERLVRELGWYATGDKE